MHQYKYLWTSLKRTKKDELQVTTAMAAKELIYAWKNPGKKIGKRKY